MRVKKNFSRNLGLLFIFIGILLLVNYLISSMYSVSFTTFFLLAGVSFILLGIFQLTLFKYTKKKIIKYMFRLIYFFLILGITSFLIIQGFILSSAFDKDMKKPDFIIILGAGIWGYTPSLTLVQRLDASMILINKYPDVKIILSGGQGAGENISEAECMRTYLVNKGVSSERLVLEDKSTSTLENLNYSRDLIRKQFDKENIKATIVTNNFHMFRAKLLAKKMGITAYGFTAEIHPLLTLTYYTRESFALVKSLIFDKPTPIIPSDVGIEMDTYKGIPVFSNGKDYIQNYGKSFSKDQYYYGYKWQCVEYI